MSCRNVKNANNGPLDPLFLSTDHVDSAFVYPGYRTVANFSWEKVTLQPQDKNSVNFNAETTYKLDLRGDFIGKVVRRIRLSALTKSSATVARYVDKVGIALSDQTEIKYGVNQLPKHFDNELEAWHYGKVLSLEEQQAADELIAGNKSAAEREALALAEQELLVEVPAFWTHDPRMYLHQHSLAQELEIKFRNRTLASLVDHNGPAGDVSATFTEELEILYYHVNNAESNAHTMRHRHDAGIVYGISTMQRVSQKTVAIGSDEFDVDLSSLTLPSRGLIVQVRAKATTTGTGGNSSTAPNDYYKYLQVTSVQIDASSGCVVPAMNDKYNRLYLQPKYFHGRPGSFAYYIPFAFEPTDPVHTSGHLSVSNFNNPLLKIKFDATTTAQWVVDVFSCAQEIAQASQGDLQLVVG